MTPRELLSSRNRYSRNKLAIRRARYYFFFVVFQPVNPKAGAVFIRANHGEWSGGSDRQYEWRWHCFESEGSRSYDHSRVPTSLLNKNHLDYDLHTPPEVWLVVLNHHDRQAFAGHDSYHKAPCWISCEAPYQTGSTIHVKQRSHSRQAALNSL